MASRQNAVLIPELAFQIQQHLRLHDLAIASRVSSSWREGWAPFLWYAVRYHRHQQPSSSLSSASASTLLYSSSSNNSGPHAYVKPTLGGRHPQHPQHHHHRLTSSSLVQVPPFLNIAKYGHWIKTLEVSNLFVAENGVVPDHVHLVQTCLNLHLTRLELMGTVMGVERLDQLLGAMPALRSFKLEVMNKAEGSTVVRSTAGSYGYGASLGSMSSHHHHHHPHRLLHPHRPKRFGMEGLEPEVIRVIARRLARQLERLELVFVEMAKVDLPCFEELLASCGSTLKGLSLKRADICKEHYGRYHDQVLQADIAALLTQLATTSLEETMARIPSRERIPSSSAASFMSSSSSSSSSIASSSFSYSTGASSVASYPPHSRTASAFVGPSAIESLAFYSCVVSNEDCAWFLKRSPNLRELELHDCQQLGRPLVASIQEHTPFLETISFSSLPSFCQASFQQLFERIHLDSSSTTLAVAPHPPGQQTSLDGQGRTIGLRLHHVRLAYLRQVQDTVMDTLATHQGSTLTQLALQWCPHLTDEGILPILRSCTKLKDLSLCLSKPTLDIFNNLLDPLAPISVLASDQFNPWACASTLERLEISGQMFLDRIRVSSEYLQPQLYHHLSPNPHHLRNGSSSSASSSSSDFSLSSSTSLGHHSYSAAHQQGYPMYNILRHPFSGPFQEMQTQLEHMPQLTHLGIPAKGIEPFLKKGFGPKVRIRSLTLLNQQGRVWSANEVEELLQGMPFLSTLHCERNTILVPFKTNSRDELQQRRYEQVRQLLQKHRVELIHPSLMSLRR